MRGPTHKALFNKFRDTTVIDRCEQYAQWTLPYLMADVSEVSASGRVIVERDFQEIGALLTNNLSAKLTGILFPTQYPFFQASASGRFLQLANERGYTEEDLRTMFAKMEMEANRRLFLNAGYAALILALKHLIVTGNCLIYRDSENARVITYGLQQFAVRRDGTGELLDCVLREYTTVEALPPDLQAALRTASASKYGRPEQTVEKYTRIHRVLRQGSVGYEVSQEVDTIPVGTPSWHPKSLCPWMVPTWALIPGEHYGRGMVEDYAGGFARLSSLSEAAALYGVEIMRVLNLVGAGSGGDIDDMAQAESGEFVRGDPQQVQAYEAGDARKLEAVVADIERATQRLARAFMYQGGTRQAERVTAYELQRDAQEAENTLGGVYSTLSGGIQVPMAHVLMTEVSDIALAGLVNGELRPDVTAGIPALGRSSEVQNLLLVSQEYSAIAVLAQLDKRVDPQRLMNVVLAGRSVDSETIFFTPDQQQKNDAAQQNIQQGSQQLLQASSLADSQEQIAATLTGG